MVGARRVLRWAGAVVVGVMAYVFAFAIGYLMWRGFGGDPSVATRWILASALATTSRAEKSRLRNFNGNRERAGSCAYSGDRDR